MKIVSTVALRPPQRTLVEQAAPGAEIIDRQCRTTEEMADLVKSAGRCDVLFTFRVPPGADRIAPGLKWIQLLSAGADHALKGQVDARVAMTTSSGIHSATMAEYTIASMLAFAHKLHVLVRAQMNREWRRSGDFMSMVDAMRGHTLGLIGYGSIGRETARLGRAFGMRVLALKRDPNLRRDEGWAPAAVGDPEGVIPERFFGPGERFEMIPQCDYIAISLPLTESTRGFFGERELATMKPQAYLVNVGRGEVVDQAALIEALRAGKIGGAGLDVFEREPLEPDSPLWTMENTILTPHMSGAFKGYVETCCELFADNLRRFVAGKPLLNLVDPALGY